MGPNETETEGPTKGERLCNELHVVSIVERTRGIKESACATT